MAKKEQRFIKVMEDSGFISSSEVLVDTQTGVQYLYHAVGNSGGLTVVLTGLIQGAGAEVVFLLFRYKKWNFVSMSLAGMLSAVFIFCYELYYLNYIALAPSLLIGQLAVRFVSAIVFSGILCKVLGDLLARTGVLKSYAIGAELKQPDVYDD